MKKIIGGTLIAVGTCLIGVSGYILGRHVEYNLCDLACESILGRSEDFFMKRVCNGIKTLRPELTDAIDECYKEISKCSCYSNALDPYCLTFSLKDSSVTWKENGVEITKF